MFVPPVNHRYHGWRESAKLVAPVKGGLSSIFRLDQRLKKAFLDYEADHPPLLANLNADLKLIQSARVLIDYFKGAE